VLIYAQRVVEDERGWFGENCEGTEFGDADAILGPPDCGVFGCAASLGDSAGSFITLDMAITSEPCYIQLWQVGVGSEGEQETFSVWVSQDGIEFQSLGVFNQAGSSEVLNVPAGVGTIRYVRLRQEDGIYPPPHSCASWGADFDAVAMALSAEPLSVAFDVKPGSCPNPLNLRSKGVVPAAILGSESLHAGDIDRSSLLLAGAVTPIRISVEDVAMPVSNDEPCECTDEGPDGYDDLTLKFHTWSIRDALGDIEVGDVLELGITGNLLDGTPFQAIDCVVIVGADEIITDHDENASELSLHAVKPNPFRFETHISFTLPEDLHVQVKVFDVVGRHVNTIVDRMVEAGSHSTVWRGQDDKGQIVPPGLYFVRLDAAGEIQRRKIVLAH
jgi:hypothetical protein